MDAPSLAAPGLIRFLKPEGSVLAAGDVIASLELDPNYPAQTSQPFTGQFPALGPPQLVPTRVDQRFSRALEDAELLLAGYRLPPSATVEELAECLDDPRLPLYQWLDALAAVEARLPQPVVFRLRSLLDGYASAVERYDAGDLDASVPEFPGQPLQEALLEALKAADGHSERRQLAQTMDRLLQLAEAHLGGQEAFVSRIVSSLVDRLLKVEELFQHSDENALHELMDSLRAAHTDAPQAVLDVFLSHDNVPLKAEMVGLLISQFVLPAPGNFRAVLRPLSQLKVGRSLTASPGPFHWPLAI